MLETHGRSAAPRPRTPDSADSAAGTAGTAGTADTDAPGTAGTPGTADVADARRARRGLTRRRLLGSGGLLAAAGAGGAIVPAPRTAVLVGETGRLVEYWVALEAFVHTLAPSGRDAMTGESVPPGRYWALGYRAYSPGWRRPLPASAELGSNDGIPGPVLRARVGDTLLVHFMNNDTHYGFPHSMHPHGVHYSPEHDGAWTADDPRPGAAVKPGECHSYVWTVPPDAVGTWHYHDHSAPQSLNGGEPVMELGAELGAFGFLVVTDDDTPPVDTEILLFLHEVSGQHVPELADREYSCFNGRAYLGNTPTFTARFGQRVRWRLATLGVDVHTFHLHGHRWSSQRGNADVALLAPATTAALEYTEDNPGDWLYHCHVTEHMAEGMVGRYRVTE
jgi:manganese oxidase